MTVPRGSASGDALAGVVSLPGDRDWAGLLTPAELSHGWGKAVGTPANKRSAGTGVPYVKLGGTRVRYRLKDMLECDRLYLVPTSVDASA